MQDFSQTVPQCCKSTASRTCAARARPCCWRWSAFFGCLIGFAVGALQTIPIDKQRDPVWKRVLLKILHIFLRCYVELFRGTPMIVQAVFIYYGLCRCSASRWACGRPASSSCPSTPARTWPKRSAAASSLH